MSLDLTNICINIPLMFGTSIVLISLGIWQRYQSMTFLRTAKKTKGDVIGSEPRPTLTNTPTRCALVRFITSEGEEKLHRARFGPPWTRSYPGEQVEILYNPKNPDEARINSFAEVSMMWNTLLFIGGSLFVFSLFWLGIILLQA